MNNYKSTTNYNNSLFTCHRDRRCITIQETFLKKECLGQLRFENGVRNSCNLNTMYKISLLLKVTVMGMNTFHVNGRFTVASGRHKINRLTLAF